ncbi:glycosyltransferase family 2 protein [Cenococcum geophilum 1.58]|uniref:glycosyltransferase family 2 protein n=1 Tax=Cenococcum geophilum 1.58 TaxID=794803 RepID=UPI00358EE33B|nr:glycosyltransferase family 2 protein [Cenococcum geophilum 1.58]
MSTIRRIDDGDYIDIQQQLDNENNRRSSATASQQSTTSTFVSTPSDTLDGFRESKYELKEEYIESRAESREEIQHTSTRPPMARMSRLRSLGDLYAESPEITPLATPSQPWTLGSGRNSVNSSFTTPTPLRSEELLKPLFPYAPSSTLFDRDWEKEGSIAHLHRRDDHEQLSAWKRYLYYLTPFLAIATLGTYWLYFTLRILFVISAQRKSQETFPLAWAFIGVEMATAVPVFLQLFWSVFILKRRNRPQLRLVGNDVPTVDIFITCCGEDVDLVLDTTRATCEVDYPQDRFRVVILDDANCTDLRQAIGHLEEVYPNLVYRCRPKFPGVPHHFKAGNLNYGIQEVLSMPGGASQYVAALDADMIPEPHWLRAVIPHLVRDPKMALACPPQLFYNVPPNDPLCQSLDFFVHVSEPIKDALGVAWCTGSGYIARRDALEEIGFFPQGSIAEDVATSTLLLGRGWKTAYVHEPLQFGTVPDSFGSHLKQRTRWALGTVETSFQLKFGLWGKAIEKMTFYQRFSTFIYAVLSLFNIILTISLFALPVVLISGKPLIAYSNGTQLRWLIRACFASLFTNRLCEFALFIPSGYQTGQRGSRAQLWMSPYIALTIIRSFVLPIWLGGQKQAFKPSGSLKSELSERDPAVRAPLLRRLRVIVINYLAGYHILYVYFCLAAVTLTTSRCAAEQYTINDQLLCGLTHAFWPPIAWIIVVSAFWIPISYAINPPSMPDREALLNRDPKTGVAHPTEQSKKIAFLGPQMAIWEIEYGLSTLFTAAVFGAAFFY